MSTVSLETMVLFLDGFTQYLVNTTSLTGNTTVDRYIDSKSIPDGERSTSSDRTRDVIIHLSQHNGTTGYVNNAGEGTGIDLNNETNFSDGKGAKREYQTGYTLIERDLGELNRLIGSIMVGGDSLTGQAAYAKAMRSPFVANIRKNLIDEHYYFRRKNFYDLIDNGQSTTTVFGQILFALTGSVDNVNNLYSGAVSDASLKAVLDKMLTQKDYRGREVMYTEPEFILSDASKLSSLMEILRSRLTVDDNERKIGDIFGFYGAEVAKYPTANKVTYFTKATGYKRLVETVNGSMAPQAKTYTDSTNGNIMLSLKTIDKQVFTHREGTFQQQLA